MLTAESRRRSFPSLAEMVYLNSAAEGIPPLEVREALEQYFRDKQLGMDGRERHFAALEETKSLVAELYGLTAPEIGICSCSSEAYNLWQQNRCPIFVCKTYPTTDYIVLSHGFGFGVFGLRVFQGGIKLFTKTTAMNTQHPLKEHPVT